jgi:hypothetical protein
MLLGGGAGFLKMLCRHTLRQIIWTRNLNRQGEVSLNSPLPEVNPGFGTR